jgi:hypothetical protein
MVAFNQANDLPSNIVTVEQLSAWSGLILSRTAVNQLVFEVAGAAPELAAASNPYQILSDNADYHHRLVQRQSLRLVENWYSTRMWLAVQELSTDPIPAEFRLV